MDALPKCCCGRCCFWLRRNPDDLTAPEGRCRKKENPGHWPTGYWPATLQRDGCGRGFLERERAGELLAKFFNAIGGRI